MTRIVVTVGPATDAPDSAREVIRLGAGAFRFPASKFAPHELAPQAAEVSGIAAGLGVELDLLLDLPGAKTRLTNDRGFPLAGVDRVRIDFAPVPADRAADPPRLGLRGGGLGALAPGDTLVTGDGEDALAVTEVHADHCVARPLTAGELGRRRGVVVAGRPQRHASLTDRDVSALEAVGDTVFTAVMISFVEDAATVEHAREIMRGGAGERPLVAKVETRAGVEAVAGIAAAADAVVLGRGDLLLEAGVEDFYDLGRAVIKATQRAGRPIVVGTQIMPSLSSGWLPNRSELAYACHLIDKGVDGLLLSTETTIGTRPHRTVELLASLVKRYGAMPAGPMLGAR